MEEKFLLKQNAFITFMLNYVPIVVYGCIAVIILHRFNLPDWIEYSLLAVVFIGAILKGALPLRHNKRLMIISDKSIRICKYKKKQPVVLEQYSNDSIEKIQDLADGAYLVTVKNADNALICLSYGLKPEKELCLKVNSALNKIFGDKFETTNKTEINQYTETGAIPKSIKDFDKSTKIKRITWTVINTIVALLPTAMAILAGLWIIFSLLLVVLKQIMVIFE